jgi:hypothetical protein
MLLGEGGVGKDVVQRSVHQRGELGRALAQCVGHRFPLGACLRGGFLREDRLDHCDHRLVNRTGFAGGSEP